MKIRVILIILITLAIICANFAWVLPANADNVTTVNITFTGNTTFEPGTLNIALQDLQTIVDGAVVDINAGILVASQAHATALAIALQTFATSFSTTLTTILFQFFSFAIVFGLAFMAIWRQRRILLVVAGIGFILYGFGYYSTSAYISILLVLAGGGILLDAFITSKGSK